MECRPLHILLLAAMLVAPPVFAAVTCTTENTALPEMTPTADFTDNGDGTVTHARTGLVWMRCSLGQTWDGAACTGTAATYTWQQALQVAADVNSGASNADGDGQAGYAGQTDWRLPNRRELESIVERRCYRPAINEALFPNTPYEPDVDVRISKAGFVWSSSPYVSHAGSAWVVDFGTGGGVYAELKTNALRVRLVRAGQ